MQQESFHEARVESKLFVLFGTENYNPETATIFFPRRARISLRGKLQQSEIRKVLTSTM